MLTQPRSNPHQANTGVLAVGSHHNGTIAGDAATQNGRNSGTLILANTNTIDTGRITVGLSRVSYSSTTGPAERHIQSLLLLGHTKNINQSFDVDGATIYVGGDPGTNGGTNFSRSNNGAIKFNPAIANPSTVPGADRGIAVAKRILDAHHATVALSDRPGDGTSLHVVFPFAEREQELLVTGA